jgi:hypothetical protein
MRSALVLSLVLLTGLGPLPRSTAALAQEHAAPAAASAPATSSKIWIGREQEFEQFLSTAPIARAESIPVGVTRPRHVYFAPGGLAAGAVFKALQPGRSKGGFFESYRSEIAAYELDKLLGLGMVPPTVERRYENEMGSLQLWVENVTLLKTRNPNLAPNVQEWNRQVHRQRVWDALTANVDRNAGNLLVDRAWNLILIDHSRCFTTDSRFPFPITKIDRQLLDHLTALDDAALRQHLGALLFDGPKPVLKRRDLILKRIAELVKEKGEAAVILP